MHSSAVPLLVRIARDDGESDRGSDGGGDGGGGGRSGGGARRRRAAMECTGARRGDVDLRWATT